MGERETYTKIVISITADDQAQAEEISRKLNKLKADIESSESNDKIISETAQQLKDMGVVGVNLDD